MYEYVPTTCRMWGFPDPLVTNTCEYRVAREEYSYNDTLSGPRTYDYTPEGSLVRKVFVRSDGLRTVTTRTSTIRRRRLIRSVRRGADGTESECQYDYDRAGAADHAHTDAGGAVVSTEAFSTTATATYSGGSCRTSIAGSQAWSPMRPMHAGGCRRDGSRDTGPLRRMCRSRTMRRSVFARCDGNSRPEPHSAIPTRTNAAGHIDALRVRGIRMHASQPEEPAGDEHLPVLCMPRSPAQPTSSASSSDKGAIADRRTEKYTPEGMSSAMNLYRVRSPCEDPVGKGCDLFTENVEHTSDTSCVQGMLNDTVVDGLNGFG